MSVEYITVVKQQFIRMIDEAITKSESEYDKLLKEHQEHINQQLEYLTKNKKWFFITISGMSTFEAKAHIRESSINRFHTSVIEQTEDTIIKLKQLRRIFELSVGEMLKCNRKDLEYVDNILH